MSTRPGWIKLYNQTLDSDFWDTGDPFDYQHAFIHVLLSANWRPGRTLRNGRVFEVDRGQWLTSTVKLAKIFHWSRDKVYRWLDVMKQYEMLESSSTGFGTLITVVNYDKFQTDGPATPTGGETGVKTPVKTGVNTGVKTADATRSKTKDIRQQTEDSISACAEEPAAPDPEDDDDEGWMSPEEAIRLWESTHSDAKKPLN